MRSTACPTAANTNGAAQISGLANLANGVTSQCVEVTATAPTIAKAFGPATIASGGTSTLTITIANPNAAPITVTSVTDTFPTTPGTGVVDTFTVNYQAWGPGMEVPFVIARVALDGAPGVILTTNIVNCPPEEVEIGDRVRVLFEQHDDVFIPLFEKVS